MKANYERMSSVPVWVVGASGLLSGELLRLLEGHESLELAGLFARRPAPLRSMHPHLTSSAEVHPVASASEKIGAALDRDPGPLALVMGLPHAESAAFWRDLRAGLGPRAERVRVVDLSADYRLQDTAAYERWYGGEHADPEELERFAYGLPEHTRGQIVEASRVAAPGCFATAMQLAAVPLAREGVLDAARPWTFFAVTGSSGSGNRPKAGTHHPHRHGNMWAYGLDGHRHEAEVVQAVGGTPQIYFLPHSGPFVRGIHLTAALPLAADVGEEQVAAAFSAYRSEPFVELVTEGVPDLRRVVGSNRAALGWHVRGALVEVLVTLDNTIKGGAGQALQCLNLMLGFPEGRGLSIAGMGIV